MTQEATKTSTRRVRFADSVGRELVTIFLVDLISNFYSCSLQSGKNPFQLRAIEAAKRSLSLPARAPSICTAHSQQHQLESAEGSGTSLEASNKNVSINNNTINCISTTTTNTTSTTTTTTSHSFSFRYSPFRAAPYGSQQLKQQQQQQQQQQFSAHYSELHHLNSQQHHYHSQPIKQQQVRPSEPSQQQQQRRFVCEFMQPIQLVSFKERVRLNKVHLETCQVRELESQAPISISCTVRVLNVAYEKSVYVRYTTDDWHTHTDCPATYRPGSCDGWSDKFVATFAVHHEQQRRPVDERQQLQRIKFAIRFQAGQQEQFWDNNGGLNYTLVRR